MTDIESDFLIKKKLAAHRLGKDVKAFDRYRKRHKENFPNAIKEGEHKQSPVSFLNSKITEWIIKMDKGEV